MLYHDARFEKFFIRLIPCRRTEQTSHDTKFTLLIALTTVLLVLWRMPYCKFSGKMRQQNWKKKSILAMRERQSVGFYENNVKSCHSRKSWHLVLLRWNCFSHISLLKPRRILSSVVSCNLRICIGVTVTSTTVIWTNFNLWNFSTQPQHSLLCDLWSKLEPPILNFKFPLSTITLRFLLFNRWKLYFTIESAAWCVDISNSKWNTTFAV